LGIQRAAKPHRQHDRERGAVRPAPNRRDSIAELVCDLDELGFWFLTYAFSSSSFSPLADLDFSQTHFVRTQG
jgi:hypothetical protein